MGRGGERSGGKCQGGSDGNENNLASGDFGKIGKVDIFRDVWESMDRK